MDTFPQFYDYYDPNKLLRDLYEFKKRINPSFTFARIAKKAGIKSTGNLTDILQGRSKITARLIVGLAAAFEMKKQETQYFEALVHFSLAKTHNNKAYYFDQVLAIKKSKTKNLDLSQYEYFSRWYYIAIRELLEFYPFKDDYKNLARELHPEITVSQAKKAVEILEKTGLIQKKPDGYYEQAESIVTTGEWKSLAVAEFQRNTLELAKDALDTVSKENRSVSTVTISVSKESMLRIKEEIKRCRAKLLEISQEDRHSDRVMQVNFSAFPMTKVRNGEKRK